MSDIFHEMVEERYRNRRNIDYLHDIIYKCHQDDEHEGPFRYCSHPTCRLVHDLGLSA